MQLGVTDFIEQSEKYTSGTFENLDINEILSSAISGKIDNTKLWTGTLKIFGKELQPIRRSIPSRQRNITRIVKWRWLCRSQVERPRFSCQLERSRLCKNRPRHQTHIGRICKRMEREVELVSSDK